MALADLPNVVTISAPQISPDGRRAVALIARIDAERDRYVDGRYPHDPARSADVYARWMNYIGDHFKL